MHLVIIAGCPPPLAGRHISRSSFLRRYAACHCPQASEKLPAGPQCGYDSCRQIDGTPALHQTGTSSAQEDAEGLQGASLHPLRPQTPSSAGPPFPLLVTTEAARTTMVAAGLRNADQVRGGEGDGHTLALHGREARRRRRQAPGAGGAPALPGGGVAGAAAGRGVRAQGRGSPGVVGGGRRGPGRGGGGGGDGGRSGRRSRKVLAGPGGPPGLGPVCGARTPPCTGVRSACTADPHCAVELRSQITDASLGGSLGSYVCAWLLDNIVVCVCCTRTSYFKAAAFLSDMLSGLCQGMSWQHLSRSRRNLTTRSLEDTSTGSHVPCPT